MRSRVVGAVGFLAALVTIGSLALSGALRAPSEPDTVVVPDLSRLTRQEATRLLMDRGLVVGEVIGRRYPPGVARPGQVAETTPAALQAVPARTAVDLVVATYYPSPSVDGLVAHR